MSVRETVCLRTWNRWTQKVVSNSFRLERADRSRLCRRIWRCGLWPGPAGRLNHVGVVWNWSWAPWETTVEFLSEKWLNQRWFRECTCTWVGLGRVERQGGALGGGMGDYGQGIRGEAAVTQVQREQGGLSHLWGKKEKRNGLPRFETGPLTAMGTN